MLFTLIRSTQVTVVHEGAIVDVLLQYKETSGKVIHCVYENHSHTIHIVSRIPWKPLGKVFNVCLSSKEM